MKKQTLKNRFSLILILTIFLTVMSFQTVRYFYVKKQNIADFTENKEVLLSITISQLIPSLESNQLQDVEQILKNLDKDKDFVSAEIFKDNKMILAFYNKNALQDLNKFKKDYSSLNLERKIKSDNQKELGVLHLIFSKKSVNTNINNHLFSQFLLFLFMSVVLVVVLNYIFTDLILTPLDSLNKVVKKVAKGDFKSKAKIYNYDEIGEIAYNYNRMAETLSKNISDLEQSKYEVMNLQAYQRNIVENSPYSMIIIDENNKIADYNRAFKNSFLNRLNYQDVTYRDLFAINADLINLKEKISLVKRKGDPETYNMLSVCINEKQSIFDVLIYSLSKSTPIKIVLLFVDITEKRILESQLLQSQKMDAIGNLAGGIAHDFNNILGGIIGNLSLIRFKSRFKKEARLADFTEELEVLDSSSKRAADLVGQLLTLSRNEEIQFAAVDLKGAVKHVLKIVRSSFDKSITIQVDFIKESTVVKADPTQLEQVILNLCVNAGHAMTLMRRKEDRQGGNLAIEIKSFLVDEIFRKRSPEAVYDNYWLLSISDNGVGISRDNLNKIFNPFFTTKKKSQGTGLGLAMVYNILKNHGGFIKVYSELNQGTDFKIFLPKLDRDVELKQSEMAFVPFKGHGKVLVIDDERIMRNLVSEFLKESNYSVDLAVDGEDGIEQFTKNSNSYDLVILDMVMPKKSGKEVFYTIKKIRPDIKIILSSGFKQDERVQELIKNGVDYFVQKPYSIESISEALEAVMG